MSQRDLNNMSVPRIYDLFAMNIIAGEEGVFTREEIEAFVDYCRAAVFDAPDVLKAHPDPLTKEVALKLDYRDTVYNTTKVDSKGQPLKARVNGRCQTWKRVTLEHPANDFRLPVKYGMYENFDITPNNEGEWTAEPPDTWPQVASAEDIVVRWQRNTQRGLPPMAHQFGERQMIGVLVMRGLDIQCTVQEEDVTIPVLLERLRERDVESQIEAHVWMQKPITNLDDWITGPWTYQEKLQDKKGNVVEYALYYVSDAELPWGGRTPRKRMNPAENPLDTSFLRGSLTPAEAIAILFQDLIEKAPDAFTCPVALVVDEKTALNGRDPHSRAHACAGLEDGRGVVYIAPKLVTGFLDDGTEIIRAKALRDRQEGVLAHELGHISLLLRGDEDHTERDADNEAERLFGKRIRYDIEDVQTVGRGVYPRPKRLDADENPGRPGQRYGCRMNPRRRRERHVYKGRRGADVPDNEKVTGHLSGATWWKYNDNGFDDDAHEEAMKKAGWVIAEPVVGARVLLSFSNDHEVWGVIKKVYKKGTVDFQPDHGELYRGAVGGRDFWVRR